MLKLAGELLEGLLADHMACLDAHIRSPFEVFVVGQYRPNWIGSKTTESIIADTLYASPLIVPRATTFDRIAVEVTTAAAAGKDARLGIYKDDGSGYPGSLVVDAGTVDVDSTGVKAVIIDQSLTKGLYWCVIISDGAPEVRGLIVQLAPVGVPSGGGGGIQQGYNKTQAYGALPDPYPSEASITNWDSWLAMLRVASLD